MFIKNLGCKFKILLLSKHYKYNCPEVDIIIYFQL